MQTQFEENCNECDRLDNSCDVFLFGLVSLSLSSGHTQDWILSTAHTGVVYHLLFVTFGFTKKRILHLWLDG